MRITIWTVMESKSLHLTPEQQRKVQVVSEYFGWSWSRTIAEAIGLGLSEFMSMVEQGKKEEEA